VITKDGQTIMLYRSIDNNGNVEKIRKIKINLDLIPPSMPSIIFDPVDWTNGSVTVMINDGEDEGSGSKKSQYRLGENDWTDYVAPFSVSQRVTTWRLTVQP
jgi:hypothetical protein